MKSFALLAVLGLFSGCASYTVWTSTAAAVPWCGPDRRAHVYYRYWTQTEDNLFQREPERYQQVGYSGKSGVKKSAASFRKELDEYFRNCTFIKQWPQDINAGPPWPRFSPFQLYFVSMDPTVVVGVEKPDPKMFQVVLPPMQEKVYGIDSTYLVDFIEARTTLPYHSGAKIVWFSPAVDHDLHQIDFTSRVASFTVGENEQIIVTADGAELRTSRK